MSDATTERREKIVRQLRRVGISTERIPKLADEAEELVAAGKHPGDAVKEVFRRRAVERKRGRGYII